MPFLVPDANKSISNLTRKRKGAPKTPLLEQNAKKMKTESSSSALSKMATISSLPYELKLELKSVSDAPTLVSLAATSTGFWNIYRENEKTINKELARKMIGEQSYSGALYVLHAVETLSHSWKVWDAPPTLFRGRDLYRKITKIRQVFYEGKLRFGVDEARKLIRNHSRIHDIQKKERVFWKGPLSNAFVYCNLLRFCFDVFRDFSDEVKAVEEGHSPSDMDIITKEAKAIFGVPPLDPSMTTLVYSSQDPGSPFEQYFRYYNYPSSTKRIFRDAIWICPIVWVTETIFGCSANT